MLDRLAPEPPARPSRRLAADAAPLALALALGGTACSSPDPFNDDPWEELGPAAADPDPADRALAFDGVAEYATLGTAEFPFGLAPHTITLWVKPARLEGTQNFIVVRKDFQSGVQLGIRDGVPMAWRVFGGRTYVAAPEPLELGAWHHVGYVYDGVEHRLYLDGVEQDVSEIETNNRTATSGWLGSLDGRSEFFAGQLDRVRIWNEARSPEEITADVRGEPPLVSELIVDLHFDEAGGLRAYDASGRGNHAILGDGFEKWAPERVPSDLSFD